MRWHGPSAPIPTDARGASIALGNFDGVHMGHQAVIEAARAMAAPLGAAVFIPNPRRYFQPEAPPFRVQTPAQRARALAGLGVREFFEISFNASLAQMSAAEFARVVLQQRLGVAHVSVGADFRFGKDRAGDAGMLRQLGAELGFGVSAVAPVERESAKIASTMIRVAISAGEMAKAAAMLTRPWAIEGVVQRGFGRGRGFGFATANLSLGDYVRPRPGVYAVRVSIDGVTHDGVASVGVNPTVGALPEPVLEAHLFGWERDLYGETIEVELHAFLRDEVKFDDVEALKAQMTRDAENARAALRRGL